MCKKEGGVLGKLYDCAQGRKLMGLEELSSRGGFLANGRPGREGIQQGDDVR